MSDLRGRIIRLAHSHPELRPSLLPLVKEAATLPADHAIKQFVEHAQSTIDKHQEEHGFSDKTELTIMWGPKFARIVKTSGSARSVFGFVDRTTGEMLKAASWKAPAKGARGNVFERSTWDRSHGPYGMAYFR